MLTDDDLRARYVEALSTARERSQALTDAVDDDDLVRQHSPLMSPLVWDLAHIGSQEELWLLRNVDGAEAMRRRSTTSTTPSSTLGATGPRCRCSDRPTRRYVREVRSRVTDVVERTRLDDPRDDLRGGGFVFGMVVQHEQQHDETMLATHQLRTGAPVLHAPAPDAPWAP